MSISFLKRPRSISTQSLLQKELFSHHFHELDKALNSTTGTKSHLKMYVQSEMVKQFSMPLQQLRKRIKSSELKKISKSKLLLLNESILNIFYKNDDSRDKSMRTYRKNKKENDMFMKKFNNLQKVREKIARKKINSTAIGPSSFSFFDDLVKKYKMNDILIKSDMFKNKDLFRSTPIILKDKQDLKFFYLFNHSKYFRKTNPRFNKKSNIVKNVNKEQNKDNDNNNENKIDKNKDEIIFERLKQTQFFKKLIIASRRRLKELNKNKKRDDSEDNDEDYNYENDINFNNNNNHTKYKKLNYHAQVVKDKREIDSLIKNINMLNKDNVNIIEDYKSSKCNNNIFNKIFNNNNNNNNDISLSFDSFSNIKSAKRTGFSNKSCLRLIDKESTLNIKKPIKNMFLKRFNRNKSEIKYRANSSYLNKNNFNSPLNLNQISKKRKITPNTRTTFYSVKSKNKDNAFGVNNGFKKKCSQKFEKLIENLKDTEGAYEILKKMTFTNKEKALKKIGEYFNSKGYSIDKIKNNIKQKEIYNFLDRIKEVINKFNCKQEMDVLHFSIHKRMSDKMNEDLNEISNLDKVIQGAENMYYLSLLKGQS